MVGFVVCSCGTLGVYKYVPYSSDNFIANQVSTFALSSEFLEGSECVVGASLSLK